MSQIDPSMALESPAKGAPGPKPIFLDDGTSFRVGSIYCVGRNYAAHARELGNPVQESEPIIFLKSPASVRGLEAAPVAFSEEELHYEAELVVLIGKPVPLASDPGLGAIAGIGLGLDLTRRALQKSLKAKGLPWTPAKSFQGSAIVTPFSPCPLAPQFDDIVFTFSLGGEMRQKGAVKDMQFSVPEILKHLSTLGELYPGDIVFTGTPEGVGPIKKGQGFSLGFQGTGILWHGVF